MTKFIWRDTGQVWTVSDDQDREFGYMLKRGYVYLGFLAGHSEGIFVGFSLEPATERFQQIITDNLDLV